MGEIIDVEFKEITELEDKTNEELCQEVNLYWNQMEALGRLGFEFAARAGQRLNVIKSRLKHGEWEDWAENNLCFSTRKANRMMKLAEKMTDEDEKKKIEEELVICEDTWQTDRTVLEMEIETLKGELRNRSEMNPAILAEKEKELQNMQDKLDKEKEKSKKLKESIDAEK